MAAVDVELPPLTYPFDLPSIFEAHPALRNNPHVVNLSQGLGLDFNLSRKRGEPLDSSHVMESQRACKLFKTTHGAIFFAFDPYVSLNIFKT